MKFDQEVTLVRWTQPSGPLCLWQCFKSTFHHLTFVTLYVWQSYFLTDWESSCQICWQWPGPFISFPGYPTPPWQPSYFPMLKSHFIFEYWYLMAFDPIFISLPSCQTRMLKNLRSVLLSFSFWKYWSSKWVKMTNSIDLYSRKTWNENFIQACSWIGHRWAWHIRPSQHLQVQ